MRKKREEYTDEDLKDTILFRDYFNKRKYDKLSAALEYVKWYNKNLEEKLYTGIPLTEKIEDKEVINRLKHEELEKDYKDYYTIEDLDEYVSFDQVRAEYELPAQGLYEKKRAYLTRYSSYKVQYELLIDEVQGYQQDTLTLINMINGLDTEGNEELFEIKSPSELWYRMIDNLDMFCSYLNHLITELKSRMVQIEEAINSLQNTTEQRVLWCRFISGIPRRDIAEMIGLNSTQVANYLTSGIQNIIFPDEILNTITEETDEFKVNKILPGDTRFTEIMDRIIEDRKDTTKLLELFKPDTEEKEKLIAQYKEERKRMYKKRGV